MCEACGVSGLVCGRSTYVRGLRADLLLPRPVLFLSRGRQLKCSTACGLMGHPFRCTGLAGQQSRCKDCVVCADVQPRCRTRRARSEGPVGVTGGAKPLHQTGCQGWYAPACVGEPMSTVTPRQHAQCVTLSDLLCRCSAGKSITLLRLPGAVRTGLPVSVIPTARSHAAAVVAPRTDMSEQPAPQAETRVGQEASVAVTLPATPIAADAPQVGCAPASVRACLQVDG